MTGGANSGTGDEPVDLSGRLRGADPRDLRLGSLVIAGVVLAAMVVNALTEVNDTPDVASWEPWVWESSSAVAALASLWLPWLTACIAPPIEAWRKGWRPAARLVLIHLAGAVVYTALHVTGFVLLRTLAYSALNADPYDFGDLTRGLVYEFRKDLLSYAAFVTVFWLTGRLRGGADTPLRPVSFDIRDGGRIIRAPLDDILAVSSAGNYVEVWLADGRRPLMRTTLAAVEVELGAFGFLRAHRSWLVNTARVTGLAPDGSGDWTVELGPVRAPVSRRYPDALARLKMPT